MAVVCVCVCLCLCVRRPLPIRLKKGTKCVQQTGGCATLRQHVLGMECCAGYEPVIGEGLEAQHGKADSSCVSQGTEMSRPKLSKYSRTAGVLNLRRNASDRRKTHAFFFKFFLGNFHRVAKRFCRYMAVSCRLTCKFWLSGPVDWSCE